MNTEWESFDQGSTLGQTGSENGIILRDEEHPVGAQITLEKNGFQPFAITCGIYGMLMVHTTFASEEKAAFVKYEAMKSDLSKFLLLLSASQDLPDDDYFEKASNWFSEFIDRF